MKKLLALVLALAMVLSAVACASQPAATNQPSNDSQPAAADQPSNEAKEPTKMTIALRAGAYAEAIKSSLPAFEAANNVTFDVLELSEDDLHSSIALDATNPKGTYDFVMADASWMAEFANAGVLADLGALGYSFDEDIIPATTAACVFDGKTYLAPYYGNVTVLMYNKALVEAAGYKPEDIKNLDDMMKICKAAQDAGKKGFIYRGDTNNNLTVDFLSILASFGGWVVDENQKPTVNTPEFKEAVEFYLDLIATGDAEKKDDLIASVEGGAGTMGIGWPGWYKAEFTGCDYTAITGVAHEGGKAYNANVYGTWLIGVPANAPDKELSVKLLAHLMDKDVQKATIAVGGVPCRYSCLNDAEVLKDHPQFAVVCKALEGGVYRPIMKEWPQMYDIIGSELGAIINGVKTVDQGLADAQTQLEGLFK